MVQKIKHNTGTEKMNGRIFGLWLAAMVAAGAGARAQWVVQTVVVHEGWNAVALQVEPEEGAMEKVVETVGAGNVEGIWRWDKRFSTAEYVVDEGAPLAMDPHWKVWYPGEELGALSTLGGLSGGQCYLVKVKEGAGTKTVEIKGKARLPRVEWYPNALNLVGFAVGENGVSFEEWFEADPAVDLSKGYDNHAWQVAADGNERVVSSPAVQKLSAGEAVWVRCNGAAGGVGGEWERAGFRGGADEDGFDAGESFGDARAEGDAGAPGFGGGAGGGGAGGRRGAAVPGGRGWVEGLFFQDGGAGAGGEVVGDVRGEPRGDAVAEGDGGDEQLLPVGLAGA